MAKEKRRIRWLHSIQTKQMIGFALTMVLMMVLTFMLQTRAIEIATETTYEKMNANADYYLDLLENEIAHVHDLQMDFFNDRKLPFLVSSNMSITDYERREYLLSVHERLMTITGVSDLVENGVLFLPKTNYQITQTGVSRMEEAYVTMQAYMGYNKAGLSYDGTGFCLVETGVPRIQTDYTPNHMLVIRFSQEAIRRSMDTLNTSQASGAFFYTEQSKLLLENSTGDMVGTEIYGRLQRDETGRPAQVQRLQVAGDWYLIFVEEETPFGLFAQYVKEEPIMHSIYRFRTQMLFVFGLMTLMAVMFIMYTHRLVHKPMEVLLAAFAQIKTGNWSQRIHRTSDNEFGYLYEGFNDMASQTQRLINENYIQTNLVQRAQLKHLQAQINPHFLYNSFFTLSRRVKRHDYEGAQELTEHLGNYFQFLTRDASDTITLKQEVIHAKSYAAVQGTRFVSRLSINFEDLPSQYEAIMVPRLIIQPLLENAFEHGLENTIKDGLLQVSFPESDGALLICVEDNGQGVTQQEIEQMQQMLDGEDDGEITGICNIHRRLRIFYNNKSGLQIERSHLGGVRVTIIIQDGGKGHEPQSIDC